VKESMTTIERQKTEEERCDVVLVSQLGINIENNKHLTFVSVY
jgi:hypothetical protein